MAFFFQALSKVKILIVNRGKLPVSLYGGTERVIWFLGQELAAQGHVVTYLVHEGSHCDFAEVKFFDDAKDLRTQIEGDYDLIHFQFMPRVPIDTSVPYLVTMHGNPRPQEVLDYNTVFVSQNHAQRHGSQSFVHNGLNWEDYGSPDLTAQRRYFHFLGNAAWRVKNVRGAIATILHTPQERLEVLGGLRFNLRMGIRFTWTRRARFRGMVGGSEKFALLNQSKGLIFPVRWHEPFGLAIIESLYFGCPVFGTPYGSLTELVPEQLGFLSTDAEQLAHAMISCQFSPRLCHEYAVERFNAQKMTGSYLEKYQQILSGQLLNQERPVLQNPNPEKFLPWHA